MITSEGKIQQVIDRIEGEYPGLKAQKEATTDPTLIAEIEEKIAVNRGMWSALQWILLDVDDPEAFVSRCLWDQD